MKIIHPLLASIAVGAIALAFSSPASARIVCNRYGDCWHTDARYDYDRDLAARYHPDDWYFHRHWDSDRDYHWRDYHEGRGYWRNGEWVTF
jgi:hypothetical protein